MKRSKTKTKSKADSKTQKSKREPTNRDTKRYKRERKKDKNIKLRIHTWVVCFRIYYQVCYKDYLGLGKRSVFYPFSSVGDTFTTTWY